MTYNIQILIFISLSLLYLFRRYPFAYYFILSALITFMFPSLLLPQVTSQQILVNHSYYASFALLSLLSAIVIPYSLNLLNFVIYGTLASSIYLILTGAQYSVMLASSMDGMLIACAYPLIWRHSLIFQHIIKYALRIIPILGIFLVGGSTGVGALCIFFFILLARKYLLYAMLSVVSILSVAYYFDPRLFNDSARIVCWIWSMEWWWDNANIWLGTGFGTYLIIGPSIQIMTNNHVGNWYTFMHNDYLQVLFETGIIGLVILLSFIATLLYKARNCIFLLSSVLVYSACMVIYMPTRYVPTILIASVIIKEIYGRRKV